MSVLAPTTKTVTFLFLDFLPIDTSCHSWSNPIVRTHVILDTVLSRTLPVFRLIEYSDTTGVPGRYWGRRRGGGGGGGGSSGSRVDPMHRSRRFVPRQQFACFFVFDCNINACKERKRIQNMRNLQNTKHNWTQWNTMEHNWTHKHHIQTPHPNTTSKHHIQKLIHSPRRKEVIDDQVLLSGSTSIILASFFSHSYVGLASSTSHPSSWFHDFSIRINAAVVSGRGSNFSLSIVRSTYFCTRSWYCSTCISYMACTSSLSRSRSDNWY